MRPSVSVFARIPSIKFVGGKHPLPTTIDSSVKPHVFSTGIIPGGEGAIKVSTLPKRPAPPKPVAQNTKSYILKPNDKPFDFIAVSELPKRFQPLAFDESEIEDVNSGGAEILI